MIGIKRRRLRRMEQDHGQDKAPEAPKGGQNAASVPPGIDPESGRLLKGWRWPGGGGDPVRAGA